MNNMKLLMENWRIFVNEQTALDPKAAQQLDTIIKEPYAKFATDLEKVAADPKIQAVLNHGLQDGKPEDEKVNVKEGLMVPVKNLKPTQNEIDMGKSLFYPLQDAASIVKIMKGEVKTAGKNPIVTGNNGTLILDGHHRWSQFYVFNPNISMLAVDITYPNANPMSYLKIMQLAIAADIKKVPINKADPANNLLNPSLTQQQLFNFIKTKTKPEVLVAAGTEGQELNTLLKQSVKAAPVQLPEAANPSAAGLQLLTNLVWNNIQIMRKTSQPVAGAPKRDFMPQTDDATTWKQKATSGQLNFKDTANINNGGAAVTQTGQQQAAINEGKFRITKKRG